MSRCLFCYKEILGESNEKIEFHQKCSKKFFGSNNSPVLNYTQSDILELAKKLLKSQKTVTGVQPKLSLESKKITDGSNIERFTIVGLLGQYILKPQTEKYKELPEVEDTTMHLAALSKIKTVSHSLIRLKSGELAYITKRVDRSKGRKYHMEDMCQLTERQTEHKYKGSYEQIAKAVNSFTANPGFEKVNFYELVLFCYLTGNNDMHLKNFSLLKDDDMNYNLCPAYDLVASELVVEGDDEELALNLNGKKKKLKRKDFEAAMNTSGINKKAIKNIFDKFEPMKKAWHEFIQISFLTENMKTDYHEMIEMKFANIYKT